MFVVGVCMDFVLGFVLGKLLDPLGKLVEDLANSNENQIRRGGDLGGRSSPSKSSRKHAQSKPGSSKSHLKNI